MLTITPNEAQERGLALLRDVWNRHKHILVNSPVGSGKTALAALMFNGFVKRGLRVMFIAPYTVLIGQTGERFVQYGLDYSEIGYIWADHPNNKPHAKIQVASTQTIIRRQFPMDIDLIIIDEAHINNAALIKTLRNHPAKVVGLSGTPWAMWMGDFYETMVTPTTMKECIANGILCDYELYAPTKPNLKNVKIRAGDYDEEQIAEIMSGVDIVGDIVKNWIENGDNLPTICFAVNVAHANFVVQSFIDAGIAAEVITAKTPKEDREAMFIRFDKGQTKIIVNVGTLVAGFDRDVRCIIWACPTKSEIKWVQSIGRGLRTAIGKLKAKIFDHAGTVLALGFPEEIYYDSLFSSKSKTDKEKKESQKKERQEKLPTECGACKFVKPIGVHACPRCGFAPVRIENVEVDENRNLEVVKGKKKEYSQQDKQQFYSELQGYREYMAATRGKSYNDGWVAYKFKEKFGDFPKGYDKVPVAPSAETKRFITYTNIKRSKGKRSA